MKTFEREKRKYRKFRLGDVVRLSDPLDKTHITYFREEDEQEELKIIAGSRAVVVEWNDEKPLHVVACVRLYDPSKNKGFLVTMSDQFLTLVHRLRGGDRVTFIDPLNLMHDGVSMDDVIYSRGDDPQWDLPGVASRGSIVISGITALVSFAVPSLDRSGHMVELFIDMPPSLLESAESSTDLSEDDLSEDDLSEDDLSEDDE